MPEELIWPPVITSESPAWRSVHELLLEGPPTPEFNRLILFGSGALQATVASDLLSADVDISLDIVASGPTSLSLSKAEERLRRRVAEVNSRLPTDLPYIQLCHWMTFQPANRWERRAFERTEGEWQLVYPHPYDILFSKLRRLEGKDIEAFIRVIEKTGHPTEDELINLCQENYRDFEARLPIDVAPQHLPQVVKEADLRSNTVTLWQKLWKRAIDVDREIVEPMSQRLREEWRDYYPGLRSELAKLGAEKRPRKERLPPS